MGVDAINNKRKTVIQQEHIGSTPDQAQQAARNGAALQRQIDELGPWFHNVHLPGGIQTVPDHPLGDFPAFKWRQIAPHLPADLTGWRILDVGCNAGFYTIELARRGGSVLGIDVNPHYLRQARWAIKQVGLQERVTLRRMQVYELAHQTDQFDLVLFMGVFYHLRYPLLGLDIVAQKVKRLLVFQSMLMSQRSAPKAETSQTAGSDAGSAEPIREELMFDMTLSQRDVLRHVNWPKMAFLEHRLANDPTNWWVANRAGAEAMLRSAGLRVIGHPGAEIFLCQPDAQNPSCVSTWNRAELLAATGRPWRDGAANENGANNGAAIEDETLR